ncbi:MAG: LysR family transcriptional regulator [Proteobacteria bacterium]|nr:LysR family transcriptional regulator [Pseudomonadota bacterium]
MTLRQLRYLIAIADSGLNITLAAERVHATQSGISKQLKQLEDELGFPVFLRKGKSLERITAPGAHIIERARSILAEAADIRVFAANQRKDAAGQLRIATTHTQARFALPPAIAAFRRRYPEVDVQILPASDADVLDRLDGGDADTAIISNTGATPSNGLAIALYHWQRVILVPRGHPLAALAHPPKLTDLARYPLVSYESSLRPESTLRHAFSAAGIEPQIALTARDADLIKTYVRNGLGVGVLAEMAILDTDTDLRVLSAEGLFPSCTTWLVLQRDRVVRDYTLDFVATLAPRFDRRDLRRLLDSDEAPRADAPSHWRDWAGERLPEARAA